MPLVLPVPDGDDDIPPSRGGDDDGVDDGASASLISSKKEVTDSLLPMFTIRLVCFRLAVYGEVTCLELPTRIRSAGRFVHDSYFSFVCW